MRACVCVLCVCPMNVVCKPKTRVARLMAAWHRIGISLYSFIVILGHWWTPSNVYFPIFGVTTRAADAVVATAIGAARRSKQNERVYIDAHRHASKQNSNENVERNEVKWEKKMAKPKSNNIRCIEIPNKIFTILSTNTENNTKTFDRSDRIGWIDGWAQDEVVSVSCKPIRLCGSACLSVSLSLSVCVCVSPVFGIREFIMFFGFLAKQQHQPVPNKSLFANKYPTRIVRKKKKEEKETRWRHTCVYCALCALWAHEVVYIWLWNSLHLTYDASASASQLVVASIESMLGDETRRSCLIVKVHCNNTPII